MDVIRRANRFSLAKGDVATFPLTGKPELKRLLKTAAPPYLYSGPSPIASLATVLTGLQVNARRGDAIRASLTRLGWGSDAAEIPILYGGSVTSANIGEFLAEPAIDGAWYGYTERSGYWHGAESLALIIINAGLGRRRAA